MAMSGGVFVVGRASSQWILLALGIDSSLKASISEEAIEDWSCSSTPILLDWALSGAIWSLEVEAKEEDASILSSCSLIACAKYDLDSWTSFWLCFETWKGLKIGSLSFYKELDFDCVEVGTITVDFWNWFSIRVNYFPIVFRLVLQKLFCWIILSKFFSISFGFLIL